MGINMEVIFGPPGTGKTTELARLISEFVTTDGSDSVLVCAYTKTAAEELARRGMGVNTRMLGTLHSLCFHALDRPPLAEEKAKEWNETHGIYRISRALSILDSDLGEHAKLYGDQCLNEINIARHRLVPETYWSSAAQFFWREWADWKREAGYIDFTDMIDMGYTLVPIAPGNPKTIIVDEAQDMSLLQWRLLSQWAQHATRFIVAGDDEQCLYRWCGADFSPLLAASSRRVLPQSYRVPRSHQAFASLYSDRIRLKEPKIWHARPTEGRIMADHHSWKDGGYWAMQLASWLSAEPYGTYICLAPCAYMLTPLLQALRAQGIPFGNKWRKKQSAWNPLLPPRRGVGAVTRLLDFLRPDDRLWTWQELASWQQVIRHTGVFMHAATKTMQGLAEDKKECSMQDLQELFTSDGLNGALYGGATWFDDHLAQSHAKSLAYPCHVVRHYGRQALIDEPRIFPGTGHAFKGTEADKVVFFMDLSRSQDVALCRGGDAADDVYRMMYVASTRSRDTMILAGPQRYIPRYNTLSLQPLTTYDDDSFAF